MVTLELQPSERLLSVYRQSQLTLTLPVLASLVAAAVPWWLLERADLAGRYLGLLGLWLLGCVGYLVARYVSWLLTCLVLTDQRCVVSSQESLFSRTTTEVLLTDLSQVSVTVKGLVATATGTGTVELFSQASASPVTFSRVPRPNRAAGQIRQAMAQAHKPNP